jgi:hypothetical protein
MSFKCYLAGFIEGNHIEQCIGWRKRLATHYLSRAWDIVWLDPINGKAIGDITPDGYKSSIPGKAFVSRDIKCVEEADLVIANLDNFGAERPIIGTMCELAIRGYLRKPLIIITDNYIYNDHPWIKDFASIMVSSVDELLEKKYIDYFYRGTVTARYE